MRIEQHPLHCLACKHQWMGEMPQEVPAKVWIAWIKALHCPNCGTGWRKIALNAALIGLISQVWEEMQ